MCITYRHHDHWWIMSLLSKSVNDWSLYIRQFIAKCVAMLPPFLLVINPSGIFKKLKVKKVNWLTKMKVQWRKKSNTAGSDIQTEHKQSDRSNSWPWEYWHFCQLRELVTQLEELSEDKIDVNMASNCERKDENVPEEVSLSKKKNLH